MPPHSIESLDRDMLRGNLAAMGIRLDGAEEEFFVGQVTEATADICGVERLDAGDTALLSKLGLLDQLIVSREAEIKRAELKYAQMVPITSEVDPGADTYVYQMWDQRGMAELIADPADDVSLVGINAIDRIVKVEKFSKGYKLSDDEVQKSARGQLNIRTKRAKAVKDSFERRFEQITAHGHQGTTLLGLLNNPNVPLLSAPAAASGGNSTVWGVDKTPNEVVDDLLALEAAPIITTNGVEFPTRIVLPLDKYRYIKQAQYAPGTGAPASETILSVFMSKATHITEVMWWHQCDNADAAGTGPRAIAYRPDPEAVHHEISQKPVSKPPQVKNFALLVLSKAKTFGVHITYPLGFAYMDGF